MMASSSLFEYSLVRLVVSLLLLLLLCTSSIVDARYVVYIASQGDEHIELYNVDASTGDMDFVERYETTGRGIGPLTVDPAGQYLYASARTTNELLSFEINPRTGQLEYLDFIATNGNANHISVDPAGEHLLASFYNMGQVAVFDISGGGKLSDGGIYTKTQKCAHMILVLGQAQNVVVPHTCSNSIETFSYNNGNLQRTNIFDAGLSGLESLFRPLEPRHYAVHPSLKWLYFSNENDSSVSQYSYDQSTGALQQVARWSTLGGPWFERNKVSQIHLTPDAQYLYVSNRGAESIAAYAVNSDDGSLRSIGFFSTQALEPRAFNVSPDGQYLFVAGRNNAKLQTFRIRNGSLTPLRLYDIGALAMWVEFYEVSDDDDEYEGRGGEYHGEYDYDYEYESYEYYKGGYGGGKGMSSKRSRYNNQQDPVRVDPGTRTSGEGNYYRGDGYYGSYGSYNSYSDRRYGSRYGGNRKLRRRRRHTSVNKKRRGLMGDSTTIKNKNNAGPSSSQQGRRKGNRRSSQ